MKITERLALLKAGYTKEDIASMLEEEKQAQENVEAVDQTVKEDNTSNDVLVALANEVKSLKESMQAFNRNNVDTIASSDKQDEVKKILEGLINPIQNKED